jgi:ribosomal protein L23
MKIIITEQQYSNFFANLFNTDVIFMGGIDDKPNYYNLDSQENLLRSGLGFKKKIKKFRYTELSSALQEIRKNPNAYVVLFSRSADYSNIISKEMKDKKKLFIVEPQASKKEVSDSVRSAIANGVPNSNVIAGPQNFRGAGVYPNVTKTPQGLSHWDSLKFVGSKLA